MTAEPSSPTPPSRRRWLVVLVAVAAAAAVIAAIVVWTRSSSRQTSPPSTTQTSTTRPTVTVPGDAPLTGLADPRGTARRRCAVTVKVDNTPAASPRAGIDQADVVYEEVVEGGITRLAAVFNSHAPDRVGPVRSVRLTDHSVVWPLRGIFAFSGGAPYAITSIDTAPVTLIDESRAGSAMYRDSTRRAPHNLYARVDLMYDRCADPAPQPLFTYRSAGAAPQGSPVRSVVVGFHSGYSVTWTWDAPTRRWVRSLFGQVETTESGVTVTAANVVVMFVHYQGGAGAFASEAVLTGRGYAWVLSDGRVVKGIWVRPALTRGAQLFDAYGRPIRLTPGSTWVELPDESYSVTTSP